MWATWRAHGGAGPYGLLLTSQAITLTTAIILILLLVAAGPSPAGKVLLQPDSPLPPNEIFGSEWPLFVESFLIMVAGGLAVPGILLTLLMMVADRGRHEQPSQAAPS